MENSETTETSEKTQNPPNRILRFFLSPFRHPLITVIIVCLCALSSISLLAHFDSSIADKFNQSANYLGFTTVSSVAKNRFERKAAAHQKQAARIASLQKSLQTSRASNQKTRNESRNEARNQIRKEMENKIENVIKAKDAVIDRQKTRIENQSIKIEQQKQLIIKKDARLKAIDAKRRSLRLKKES